MFLLVVSTIPSGCDSVCASKHGLFSTIDTIPFVGCTKFSIITSSRANWKASDLIGPIILSSRGWAKRARKGSPEPRRRRGPGAGAGQHHVRAIFADSAILCAIHLVLPVVCDRESAEIQISHS